MQAEPEALDQRIVSAAMALVDVPFRLHGRDPAIGLDCVGVVWWALRAAGMDLPAPPAYRLRAGERAPVDAWMGANGLVRAGERRAGDIVLARAGPAQPHFLIDGGHGLIHAHAGLGRIVLMPPPSPWPELGRWRPDPNNR